MTLDPLTRTFRGKELDRAALAWARRVLPGLWKKYWWDLISFAVAFGIGIVVWIDWILIFGMGRLFIAVAFGAVFLFGGMLREQLSRILFQKN